jgi:hypothetical protein
MRNDLHFGFGTNILRDCLKIRRHVSLITFSTSMFHEKINISELVIMVRGTSHSLKIAFSNTL